MFPLADSAEAAREELEELQDPVPSYGLKTTTNTTSIVEALSSAVEQSTGRTDGVGAITGDSQSHYSLTVSLQPHSSVATRSFSSPSHIHSSTHSLTHSLTHPLPSTHSLTHSLTLSLTDSLTAELHIRSFPSPLPSTIHSFTHPLTHLLTHALRIDSH